MPRKPKSAASSRTAARLPEHLVTHPAMLASCLEHLAKCKVVAFDTEFIGEDSYRPELCLVQVATAEQLFVIDPLSCGSLTAFWELIADPSRMVIVHAGREEMRMCHFGIGRPPAHVVDVQIAAGLVGYPYPIGLAALVRELLNQKLNKGETLTDWRRRPLSAAQTQYAFDDVRYLIPSWTKLHRRLQSHVREDWAAEEFAAFVRKSVCDEASVEKWRKIKGIGVLDRRGLAVARQLFIWRDARAAHGNRPPRSVIRDELLIDLARRPPKDVDDVMAFRGIAKADAPNILTAIQDAKAIPANACPELEERENDPPHVVLLSHLLNVILTEWCARHAIAPNLVATSSDLKRIVRARQPGTVPDTNSPLFSGWRQRVVLPELEAFLDGKRSLQVSDPRAVHPLRLVTNE
jgi:ribonuclease D